MTRNEFAAAPDQDVRDAILSDLDTSMLVEAAAGTGKTTLMVGRMVRLLAEGTCRPENLAAVTFTRKAAAEMRARFQSELDEAARSASGDEAQRLREALADIDRCYIGTIHSFCATLLRERPIEAGVGLGFRELEEDEDQQLRRQAWDEYSLTLIARDDPVLSRLSETGLGLHDLRAAFGTFCEYPDIDEWPAGEGLESELKGTRGAVKEYLAYMRDVAPRFPDNRGSDQLMNRYEAAIRRARHVDMDSLPGLASMLDLLNKSCGIIQRTWNDAGLDGKAEKQRWEDFQASVVAPALDTIYRSRYGLALGILQGAVKKYDELRNAAEGMNFRDLLMKASDLLRDKPAIRRYFRQRFTHILVDEFQDTDPIQAEVLMYLAADDPEETDWRACRPIPGSLFVVGDPKQSIYRFTRADIVTYQKVRAVMEDAGAKTVSLSANFRSAQPIIDWVNRAFENRFPETATDVAPSYVALQHGREEAGDGHFSEVSVLTSPEDLRNQSDIAAWEAAAIARTIRDALDRKLTVARSREETDRGTSPEVGPGDFLILASRKARLGVYAAKLQEYGIPHQVTGGGALSKVSELDLLHTCLTAATQPHNPVTLVAALRSALFGISDRALHEFRRAGGSFSFHRPVPDAFEGAQTGQMRDAMDHLSRYAGWLMTMPPIPAIERIVSDLGLVLSAASRPGGDVDAGSLGKAVELMRSAQEDRMTAQELVDYLGELVESESEHDAVSARSEDVPRVRIMNLHKAKGLQATIVFLADPSGYRDRKPRLHVDRSATSSRAFMALRGDGSYGSDGPLLAHPPNWEELQAVEEEFRDAERVRLLYVAATRARAQLVVSVRGKVSKSHPNPWYPLRAHLEGAPEFSISGSLVRHDLPVETVAPEELTEALTQAEARWAASTSPSYAEGSAKTLSVQGSVRFHSLRENGTAWGSAIHTMLQSVMETDPKDLKRLAEAALSEAELPLSLAPEAVELVRRVMKSPIWTRARESEMCLVEVPIQWQEGGGESGLPTVVRGVIDLAFREEAGWIIVDYKTDEVQDDELAKLIEHYRPQTETYVRAWRESTGEAVAESGLFFTARKEYVLC